MSLHQVKLVRCWQATPATFSCSLHIWQDIEMYITGHGPCPLRILKHKHCQHEEDDQHDMIQ